MPPPLPAPAMEASFFTRPLMVKERETSEAMLKKYVQGLLPSNVDVDTVYRSKLHKKALMLDNPVAGLGDFGLNTAAEHKDRTAKMKKRKVMKSKEQRAKKVFAIEKDKQRYDLYLPLHELWKQYMSELLSAEVNATNFQAKLLKADLHGCIMRVIRSKCPSYLGMEGILAQETEHTFQLITKKNQLKG
ncbi:RNase P/RNase MRP complex subunit, variant 3 [Balamuthia mandrillaris]